MISVGAAIVDITPPAGLQMAGYAARTEPATGAHDRLTARALVVGDTALVTVDVIGIDAELSRRARARCGLPDEAVTIAAIHTHGGPMSMPGRLSATSDSAVVDRIETGIVQAIDKAMATRRPAQILGGVGEEPGFAKNRRQEGGPVDSGLPVLRFEDKHQNPIAILTSYACHPVVLGPNNLTWTADYPHFVRENLEAAFPGAIAIFATGCAADINTGHSAASSLTNESKPDRSYSMAKAIGLGIAQSVASADLSELTGDTASAETSAQISFKQLERGSASELARTWRSQAMGVGSIHSIWANWAETRMGVGIEPRDARCTALNWGGAQVVAMPGEIFAQTALEIRQTLGASAPLFVIAYADDNPGYIPPRAEYDHGGYEIAEAHRFYGTGATVAPGSAENLAHAGCEAARMAAQMATRTKSPKITATEGSK